MKNRMPVEKGSTLWHWSLERNAMVVSYRETKTKRVTNILRGILKRLDDALWHAMVSPLVFFILGVTAGNKDFISITFASIVLRRQLPFSIEKNCLVGNRIDIQEQKY
jgi:hypothetical protein